MLYKRAAFFCLAILGIFTAIWCWHICFLRESDKMAYLAAVKKQELLRGGVKALPSSAYQTREGVRKDLWIAQEDKTRLHYRIDSKASLLTFLPGQQKIDILENLQDIKCWMQDKLYADGGKPMQQMRFFSADNGTYQYSAQQFIAQSVHLSLFRIPGHELMPSIDLKQAFLHGIASDASFSLSGKTAAFQAQQFKASLAGTP